jgi:pyruvate dehydrogenase E2 component (dihydrolipoamide acetyltransferase)
MPVTITALLVQSVAKALASHPRINAYFQGEKVHQYQHVNLAIAIHTEHGLTAPVIHHADELALEQITERLSSLKQKAVDRKLTSDEIEDGTFTISNLGMMGIRTFVPMVTPRQAAILGVGEIYPVSTVDEDGGLTTVHAMTLTLSADHRVVGGAESAAFLQQLKSIIQEQ